MTGDHQRGSLSWWHVLVLSLCVGSSGCFEPVAQECVNGSLCEAGGTCINGRCASGGGGSVSGGGFGGSGGGTGVGGGFGGSGGGTIVGGGFGGSGGGTFTGGGLGGGTGGGSGGGSSGPDSGSDGGDGGFTDGGLPDSGFDGGQVDGGCAGYVTLPARGGVEASRLVELAGRPRFLYYGPSFPFAVMYVECTGACDTPNPVYSSPIQLGQTGTFQSRPVLAVVGNSTLVATWPAVNIFADAFSYAECAGGCDQPSSWTVTDMPIGTGSVIDLAALGNLRAATWVRPSTMGDLHFYSECSSNCAAAGPAWSTLFLPASRGFGLSIDLAVDPNTGLLWRALAKGGEGADPPSYRECVGPDCAVSLTAWSSESFLTSGRGTSPAVVLDRATLPRIFFTEFYVHGSLTVARCIRRPCANDPSHWEFTVLAPHTSSSVTAGKAPDGRTFFASTINGTVIVGLETSDGGYDIQPLLGCSGFAIPARGSHAQASALLRPNDKWRVSFSAGVDGGGLACHSDAP